MVDTAEGTGLIDTFDGQVLLMQKGGSITTPTLLHGMEVRIYEYMDPEDSIAAMESPPDANDPKLVSAWPLNDNAGTTASAVGSTLDATTTTAVWAASEAGQAHLAGRQQIILGHPRNVRAEYVSPVHNDWRVSDELIESHGPRFTGTFKIRGLEVTSGNWERGIEHRGGPADEPTTVDITGVVVGLPASDHGSLRRTLEELLTVRGPLEAADLDLDGLRALTNPEVGLALYNETSVPDVVGTLIGSHGSHLRLARSGKVVAGRLSLPLSPSPRDTAVVDFTGGGTSALSFGDRGQLAGGDWTVGAWVRVTSTEPDLFVDTVGGLFYGGTIVENQSGPSAGFAVGLAMFRRGALLVWDSGQQLVSRDEVLQPDTWYFVAVDHEAAKRAVRVWMRAWDPTAGNLGPERLVFQNVLTGTSSGAGVGDLKVGGRAPAWSGAPRLRASDRDALPTADLASSSDPDLEFYVAAGEGSGDVAESVSSTTAALPSGARWVPDLVVDLAESDFGRYEARTLRPASRVVVNYNRNWNPMLPADIAGSVPVEERDALTAPHERHPFSRLRSASPKTARQVVVDT